MSEVIRWYFTVKEGSHFKHLTFSRLHSHVAVGRSLGFATFGRSNTANLIEKFEVFKT